MIFDSSAHVGRQPAKAQRDMQRVHAQVAQAPILAVELQQAFPIDRLVGIQIAAVPQAAFHLDDLAEAPFPDVFDDLVRAGEEGKLRRAAGEDLRMLAEHRQDLFVGRQVDAERLFAQQVFPRLNDIHIQPFMQIVRHRAINRLDCIGVQQIMIVLCDNLDALKILDEPAQHGRIAITYPHNTRHHILVEQMTPARHRAAKLPPHQATTNNAKVNHTFLHKFISCLPDAKRPDNFYQPPSGMSCHPERSEGSDWPDTEILRCAQDDTTGFDR